MWLAARKKFDGEFTVKEESTADSEIFGPVIRRLTMSEIGQKSGKFCMQVDLASYIALETSKRVN